MMQSWIWLIGTIGSFNFFLTAYSIENLEEEIISYIDVILDVVKIEESI